MSEYESDIDIKPSPKKTEHLKEKKLTTKMMIADALKELKTRKGVSVYAIKKHLAEKFLVNTEKSNFVIKKALKSGVEDGTFVQLKGIGASGSYKLAVNKEKVKNPKKKKTTETRTKEDTKDQVEKPQKPKKKQPEKKHILKMFQDEDKAVKKGSSKKRKSIENPVEVPVKKPKTIKAPAEKKVKKSKNAVEPAEEKVKKVKMAAGALKPQKLAKGSQTPAKKKLAMIKRKSTGSIIKPPKMKPK